MLLKNEKEELEEKITELEEREVIIEKRNIELARMLKEASEANKELRNENEEQRDVFKKIVEKTESNTYGNDRIILRKIKELAQQVIGTN